MESVYRATQPNAQEDLNLKQRYNEELKHRKLTVTHLLKDSPYITFHKSRRFIKVTEEYSTGPYSEPDKFIPHFLALLIFLCKLILFSIHV